MKKILLLAAVAAPLFSAMAAEPAPETGATTKPVQGQAVLKYELPKGTFYAGNTALLPPTVQLQWINTSYYFGEGLIDDATFQWLLPVAKDADLDNIITIGENSYVELGTETDLTTPATFAIPDTVAGKPGIAPVLYAPGTSDETYSAPNNIFFGQANEKIFRTYINAKPTKVAAFTFGSPEANTLWSAIYPDLSNASVAGFAQKIEYPGTPYILNSISVLGAEETDTYTVDIYVAPKEEGAMPSELLFSATVTGEKAVVSIDKTTGKQFPIAMIDTDIIITIDGFSGAEFQPKVAVAAVEEGVPAPTTQGLYAILSGMDANGNQTQILAEYGEVLSEGGFPVALDLDLGVAYSFFIPESYVASGKSLIGQDKVKVLFDGIVSMVQVRCITNADPKEITFTTADGDELPSWISATVADEHPVSKDAEGKEVELTQCVTVTFSQNSTVGGTVPVVVNFPNGAYAGFTVTTDPSSGISATTTEAAVVGREYYDITGRRLNEAPRAGFYIEKAIKADGSVESISRIR